MSAHFVSGIDTSCGKTFVTGALARRAAESGLRVATQKFVQTGCAGVSEDIEAHRAAMGVPLLPEDEDGTTCPYIFAFPASPHLAARMEGVEIDPERIARCTEILESRYDEVFIEGAGGLMVPVTEDMLTIDYVAMRSLPLILVASAKLGSINHALLSIDACLSRGVRIERIVYNDYPAEDPRLSAETAAYIERYAAARCPGCAFERL